MSGVMLGRHVDEAGRFRFVELAVDAQGRLLSLTETATSEVSNYAYATTYGLVGPAASQVKVKLSVSRTNSAGVAEQKTFTYDDEGYALTESAWAAVAGGGA